MVHLDDLDVVVLQIRRTGAADQHVQKAGPTLALLYGAEQFDIHLVWHLQAFQLFHSIKFELC